MEIKGFVDYWVEEETKFYDIDCATLDGEFINEIFKPFKGKNVKITIEEVDKQK